MKLCRLERAYFAEGAKPSNESGHHHARLLEAFLEDERQQTSAGDKSGSLSRSSTHAGGEKSGSSTSKHRNSSFTNRDTTRGTILSKTASQSAGAARPSMDSTLGKKKKAGSPESARKIAARIFPFPISATAPKQDADEDAKSEAGDKEELEKPFYASRKFWCWAVSIAAVVVIVLVVAVIMLTIDDVREHEEGGGPQQVCPDGVDCDALNIPKGVTEPDKIKAMSVQR